MFGGYKYPVYCYVCISLHSSWTITTTSDIYLAFPLLLHCFKVTSHFTLYIIYMRHNSTSASVRTFITIRSGRYAFRLRPSCAWNYFITPQDETSTTTKCAHDNARVYYPKTIIWRCAPSHCLSLSNKLSVAS